MGIFLALSLARGALASMQVIQPQPTPIASATWKGTGQVCVGFQFLPFVFHSFEPRRRIPAARQLTSALQYSAGIPLFLSPFARAIIKNKQIIIYLNKTHLSLS